MTQPPVTYRRRSSWQERRPSSRARTAALMVITMAVSGLAAGCGAAGHEPAQPSASAGSAPGPVATGAFVEVGPVTTRTDPACALVTLREASAVFGAAPEGPQGSARDKYGGFRCWYDAFGRGYDLEVVLYRDMSPSGFAAEDFEPTESAFWRYAAPQIGDQAIAWSQPGYSIIAFRKRNIAVVISLVAAVRPLDTSWIDAVKIAKTAAARI
jgi:hypothetical protein